MAERRMFAKSVVQQDSFIDMPLSAQALFFHLGMEADDDGFLDNVKRVMRSVNASNDDMRLLIAKGFVLDAGDGVFVMTHWKVCNYLRPDRYKPTSHTEKMLLLSVTENKKYTLNSGMYPHGIPCGIPTVASWETQDRIGKDSIESISPQISSAVDEKFAVFWKAYPKKKGKTDALKAFKKIKPTQDMLDQMLAAIEKQKKTDQWQRERGQYIPYPAKWLKHGQWEDEVDESAPHRVTRADKELSRTGVIYEY